MASMNPNYQPILDTRQNRLSYELSHADSIVANTLGVLAANIAVLIFIAQASLSLVVWQWVLLIAPLVASLVFNIMAMLWAKPYRTNVSMTDHPEYLSMDEEDLLLQLIADTEGAIEENAYYNAIRQSWWSLSLGLSGLGSVCLLLYFLI
jgi:hypothetical protein